MTKRIAVAVVLGLCSAGLAFAEAGKPPPCEAGTKGVMWNFGSDARPDIRRCDGISYIPYALPCGAGASAGAQDGYPAPPPQAQPANAVPKQQCESNCANAQRQCNADCHGIITDTACIERCTRAKVQCTVKCN